MPRVSIICLANSRKHGGRCVAGLRLDGGGWLRAVSPLPNGTLHPRLTLVRDGPEISDPTWIRRGLFSGGFWKNLFLFIFGRFLGNHSEAAVLDVVEVGVRGSRAAIHQPENREIDGKMWSLLARPMGIDLISVLRNSLMDGPELLRGFADRVNHSEFLNQPADASLALIAPERLELYHQQRQGGKPQARGRFSLGTDKQSTRYDLAITDPGWDQHVMQHGPMILLQSDHKFLATISLGEPFGNYCYKLIAAIVFLPPNLACAI